MRSVHDRSEGTDIMANTRTDNTKLRIFITILLGILVTFLYHLTLNYLQRYSSMERLRKEMAQTARYLTNLYPSVSDTVNSVNEADQFLRLENMDLLAKIVEIDPDFEISDEYMAPLGDIVLQGDVMITDRDGQVLASASGKHKQLPDEVIERVKQALKDGSADEVKLTEKAEDNGVDTDYQWCFRAIDQEHVMLLKSMNLMVGMPVLEDDGWHSLLDHRTIGKEGYVFVWEDETGRLIYYPDSEKENQTIEDLGLDRKQIQDGKYEWVQLDGKERYLYASLYQEKGIWIGCAITREDRDQYRKFILTTFCVSFALLALLLVYYVILLLSQKKVPVLRDFAGMERKAAYKTRRQKLLILTCLLTVLLFLFQFYLQTLYLMSTWSGYAYGQTEQINETVKTQESMAGLYADFHEAEKKQQLSVLAAFLSDHQDLCSSALLDDISYRVDSPVIQILDAEGNIMEGTSSMAYPGGQDYEPPEDAGGSMDAVASQDKGKPIYQWMSQGRAVLLPMEDKGEKTANYLFVRYYSAAVDDFLRGLALEGTLQRAQPGNGGLLFAIDKDTRTFAYYPDEMLTGKDVLQYGITENQLKDNYCDYITLDGTSYYTVSDELGTYLVYYSIAGNRLLSERATLCVLSAVAATVLFLIAGLALYTSREQPELVLSEDERHVVTDDRKSPEHKTLRVLEYYLISGAALVAVYSMFRSNLGNDGVIGYVLDGKWEYGFNVFALFASAITLSEGGIFLFLFTRIVRAIGDILPLREGTILKMIGSLVSYLAFAFLIYRCMIYFGLNPTALMASAGIVSVILGIGANSLVGDILAGIFLLMERNVQVGDVVQIGDFRGYVTEMGIRMVKLFDMDMDDVKIIPNNEVRNVVHMTMHVSIVYSDFQIRYEENLESVEKILREELKKMKHKSPMILEGPEYIGVMALDTNGVVLRTKTKCHEQCRRKVEREVNHIVYSIFQKNNIQVPYPQVTLHEGEDEPVER